MVRCKFRCVKKDGIGLGFEVVTTGSPENESFFKWKPSGRLEFYVVNAAVAKQFELGKEYYLDITPA